MDTEMDNLKIPIKCHYPHKDQQAYTIINMFVFVNTIQKEIDME